MATLTASATKGQPYFEGTQTLYLTHDNSSDKMVGGVYSHNTLEASATEYDAFMSCVLWMIQLMKNGAGSFQVYNNTGSSIGAGAIAITGHQGTDANGQPIFQIKPANSLDAAFLPANAFLLTALANATQGTAYLGGTLTPTTALDATATLYSILCNTTNTSTTVTLGNTQSYGQQNLGTEQLEVGMAVSGTGIPAATVIASIVDRNTFTISNAATATSSSPVTLAFKASVGSSVYVGSNVLTLSRPTNTNSIMQIVGKLQTATSTSIVDAAIAPPVRWGGVNLQDEGVLLYKLEKRARQNWNYLINGDFNFFQRLGATPTTLTAAAAYGGYVADRWYLTGESATNDQQAAQVDESATSGFQSFYSCNVKNNNAGTKRIAISQVIESYNAIPLRGRQVCFQFQFNPSTSRNLRAAIISAQSSSTKDTFTAAQRDVVNTWSSSTYTTGNFFKATSGVWTYTVVAVSASLTGTAGTWSGVNTIQGTVPNDCQNLICIVWDDAGAPTGATFKVTQCGLFDGPAQRDWLPRPVQQERALCWQYCYAIPNQNVPNSRIGLGAATSTSAIYIYFAFPVRMRTTPSQSFLGTPGHISGAAASAGSIAACTAAPTFINPDANGCLTQFNNASATWAAANTPCQIYWSTAASTDAIIFDAEM